MSALRAAYEAERAFLRGCEDQRAVLDRMSGYRDNLATARRNGNGDAYALIELLIELGEDRLAELKARALKAKRQRAATAQPSAPRAAPPPPAPEPAARPTAAPARSDDSEVVRRLQAELAASQEAQRRASQERDEADRRARRATEEREALLAEQRRSATVADGWAARPSPPPVPPAGAVLRLSPAASSPTTPSNAGPTSAPPTAQPTTKHPRAPEARTSPPSLLMPTPAPPRATDASKRALPTSSPTLGAMTPASDLAPSVTPPSPSPSPTAPASRTPALTGADLAAFRRRTGLTQVAAAQRLGVTQGTISKAEGNPRAVLGPALAEALQRAVA